MLIEQVHCVKAGIQPLLNNGDVSGYCGIHRYYSRIVCDAGNDRRRKIIILKRRVGTGIVCTVIIDDIHKTDRVGVPADKFRPVFNRVGGIVQDSG